MSELMRLDDLIWLADTARNDRNRVFQCNARDVCAHQQPHKVQRLVGVFPSAPTVVPMDSRHAQIGARRMRDHQIPPVVQNVAHVSLVMRSRRLCRKQVARHRIVTQCSEGIAHGAAVFAGYENFHAVKKSLGLCLRRMHALPLKQATMKSPSQSTLTV